MTSMRRSSKRETATLRVTDKGVRGHSSPGLAAHAGCTLYSGVRQTGSTLHGGRQEGQEGDDTDRCGRRGAAGGEHARVWRGR